MNLRLKKRLIWILGSLLFLVGLTFVLNYSIEKSIKQGLKELPETVKITYKYFSVNTLTGNLKLIEPTIQVYGKTRDTLNFKATLKSLSIEGFSYWTYFINKKIAIDGLLLDEPKIIYYHNDLVEKKTYNNKFSKSLKYDIDIESLVLNDGFIRAYQVSNDSLVLQSENIHLNLNDIIFNQQGNKPEFSCKNYNFKNGKSFFNLNATENLTIKALDIDSELVKITDLKLKTKYSKEALSKIIKFEKDHFELQIDSIAIMHPDIGLNKDVFYDLKSPMATIYHADFDVYRDQLLPDNKAYKALYSKLLRELDFKFGFDFLNIENTSISYVEKVDVNVKSGELLFSEINAEIKNVGNIYNEKTYLDIDALFMKSTPLHIEWDFDVNDKTDAFIFKSEFGRFATESLNQFMTPNLNIKLEGEVEKLFFTISGNDVMSNIDAKIKYDNFDVIILREDGREKNRLLSAVLNIFISKDSRDDAEKFSYGSKEGIERDKTKSMFCFVWISLREALLSAVVGNGEKSD